LTGTPLSGAQPLYQQVHAPHREESERACRIRAPSEAAAGFTTRKADRIGDSAGQVINAGCGAVPIASFYFPAERTVDREPICRPLVGDSVQANHKPPRLRFVIDVKDKFVDSNFSDSCNFA
jgi:hypothetical protein